MTGDPGRTYDEPLDVETYEGEVVITGPAATSYALTPQAAARTATRLAQAARQAADRDDLDAS
ncbi:MAG TPA: hypothetical protein VGG92_09160 [Caulobacteraceae bacterium]|jgi:hypothetical protein